MMEIKLYQVNMDRDENRVAYESLACLPRFQGSAEPKSELYDLVFEGKVETNWLDGVFNIFNTKHPVGYTGRSMSTSDVLEVVSSDSEDIKPGFYFCDSIGFKEVPFEPEKAVIPDTMTVLYLAPGEKARVMEIDPSLRSMQRLVLGHIEGIYPFTEDVCIVCNDESKINGMDLNRAIYAEGIDDAKKEYCINTICPNLKKDGVTLEQIQKELDFREMNQIFDGRDGWDDNLLDYSTEELTDVEVLWDGNKEQDKVMIEIIAGPCFICDCSGESYASLSDEQIQRYMKMFELPEQFLRVNGKFVAVPYDPDKKIDNIISQAKQKTEAQALGKTQEQER